MKKTLLFIAAIILIPQISSAAVLYDSSAVGDTFTFDSAAGGYTWYVVDNSTDGYNVGGSGVGPTSASSVAEFKMSAISGTCPAQVRLLNRVGNWYFWALSGTYNAGSDTCSYTSFSNVNDGYALSSIIIPNTYTTAGNTTKGSYSVTGKFMSGTNSGLLLHNGHPAFQLCDSGGCSGGFAPPTPTITIPAGGTGTDFSYWSGSFDVGNMTATSTHWLPSIRWGVAASTSTATTTIANDSQLFYSGSTSFLIQKSSTLSSGVQYWYQGRLYNPDFSSEVIATSTIEYFSITGPAPDGSDLDECGIGNLFGCLKNAFVWLLYPSEGLKTSYDSMIDTLKARPPAGYFYIVANNISGLNASSTPVVSLEIPTEVKNKVFSPFDTAFSGLLWAMFAFLFYKRLKHIQL